MVYYDPGASKCVTDLLNVSWTGKRSKMIFQQTKIPQKNENFDTPKWFIDLSLFDCINIKPEFVHVSG